jgi:hypothetical protein
MNNPLNQYVLRDLGADFSLSAPQVRRSYLDSVLVSVRAVTPLTSPMINITAGINCPTTINAKKPRKIQIKIPSSPGATFAAASAVAGINVTIRAAKVFMAFSFQLFCCLNYNSINSANRLLKEINISKTFKLSQLCGVVPV